MASSDEDARDQGASNPEEVRRHCTDCACCVVFAVSLAALAWIYVYALTTGKPQTYLGLPLASGEICGVTGAVKNKTLLYICPGSDGVPSYEAAICAADCRGKGCKGPTYPAESYGGLLCIPNANASQAILDAVAETTAGNDVVRRIMQVRSIQHGSGLLVGCGVAGIVFSFLYLYFLEKFTCCLVWLGLAVLIFGTGGVGALMILDSQMNGADGLPSTGDSQADLAIGAVASTLCLIFTCIALCKRKEVEKAVSSISSAAECIKETPSMLLEPLIAIVVKLGLFAVLGVGLVYLLACADGVSSAESIAKGSPPLKYSDQEYAMLAFYVFMTLWLMELSTALSTFVIAYMTQRWFFKAGGPLALVRGYSVGIFYHLGSLAFGSFVIALVRFVRIIISAFVEGMKDTGNTAAAALACVANCIVTCFERVLQKLNKFAYMDIAINSNSFCTAAGHAVEVLASNATAAMTVTGATFLFEIAGVGSVTAAGAATAYLLSTQVPMFSDPAQETFIQDPVAVSVVAGVVCFTVSIPFMLVFSTVADTVLFCFALERHRTPMEELKGGGCVSHFKACMGYEKPAPAAKADYDHSRHPPRTQGLLMHISR